MTDLLPCPFCGAEAERVDNGPTDFTREMDGGSFIHCKKCDASTAIHFDRKEHLVASWNERDDGGLREAAEAVYNSWAGGEPMDQDMRDLGKSLGFDDAP